MERSPCRPPIFVLLSDFKLYENVILTAMSICELKQHNTDTRICATEKLFIFTYISVSLYQLLLLYAWHSGHLSLIKCYCLNRSTWLQCNIFRAQMTFSNSDQVFPQYLPDAYCQHDNVGSPSTHTPVEKQLSPYMAILEIYYPTTWPSYWRLR